MNACRISRKALVWSAVAGAVILAGPTAIAGQIGSGKTRMVSTNGQIGSGVTTLKRAGNDLRVVGAIESVNFGAGTVTVLGQTVQVGDVSQLATLAANRVPVAVFGKATVAGVIVPRAIVVAGSEYVDGASEVYLKGVVTAVDSARGTAKIGAATVDFTASLYGVAATDIKVGTVVELVGTRPAAGGAVLADAVTPLGQIGSGLNGQIGNGQIGSGIDGQIGSGLNGQIGSGIDGQIGSGLNGQIGSRPQRPDRQRHRRSDWLRPQRSDRQRHRRSDRLRPQRSDRQRHRRPDRLRPQDRLRSGQIGSGIDGQIGSGLNGQIGSGIDGQIGSGLNGQIGSGLCAPSMGAIFGVQVPGRAGHSEASEAQLREGDRAWRGSAERKP
jgi:hypothetical protein